jgi:hypothetical protein
MNKDFSPILNDWKFDPGDICARKIIGVDGREKLQVRLDLGVLQMELTGRPDSARPNGYESALDDYLDRLEDYRVAHGSDEGFCLDEKACAELWQESVYYYHRYICLLRLEDYEGVLRDTAHNLALFDLVKAYTDDEEAKLSFEQYRPYVIMVHARSKGEICLQSDDYDGALEVVQEGIEEIRSFFEAFGDPELIESSEELQALETWAEEIRHNRPLGLKQRLSQQLKEAIAEEKYELAARIRDRLQRLEGRSF